MLCTQIDRDSEWKGKAKVVESLGVAAERCLAVTPSAAQAESHRCWGAAGVAFETCFGMALVVRLGAGKVIVVGVQPPRYQPPPPPPGLCHRQWQDTANDDHHKDNSNSDKNDKAISATTRRPERHKSHNDLVDGHQPPPPPPLLPGPCHRPQQEDVDTDNDDNNSDQDNEDNESNTTKTCRRRQRDSMTQTRRQLGALRRAF
ncbi:hypothetical protein EDB85DRAFT_1889241 [Lactarius pseudohatsudake]|nr:hypothetical protein EDB85DRAFT_1889241 [Lactarius pseudohatsudake]